MVEDDDNLIERIVDKVDDVVDEVLAEGIEPEESESPWERRARRLENWTAIILAIAAVATTWATFQTSLWSDVSGDADSRSAILRSEANQAASRAARERIIDSELWLEWLAAYESGNETKASFFRERFSPQLDAAQRAWVGDAKPGDIPPGTPLDDTDYRVPAEVEAERLSQAAEDALAEGEQASATSTAFTRLAVLFALSLFFAGVATKFDRPKVQALLLLTSIIVLAIGMVRMLLLPQAY